ncbi:MAG: hypothetical protein AAGI01_07855 [Myxococcota bacterium]
MNRMTHIAALCIALCALSLASSCASYSEQVQDARFSVASGRVDDAIAAYNDLLDVDDPQSAPDELKEDHILFLLERATLLQAQGNYAQSARDMMAIDQRLEWLDIEGTNAGDIAKYLYSEDVSNYRAPPYERLMLNTLNMLNFIGMQDLEGARVEARRFTIMQSFYIDGDGAVAQPELLRLGNYVAGAVFEASMDHTTAARYYARAYAYGWRTAALSRRLVDLFRLTTYAAKELEDPDIAALLARAKAEGPLSYDDYVATHQVGDTLVVLQHGVVPYKEAVRIPVAVAMRTAGAVTGPRAMSPRNLRLAHQLAATNALNTIHFPQLTRRGLPASSVSAASVHIDGQPVRLALGMNVTVQVQQAWDRIAGPLLVAAISRSVTRAAIERASDAGHQSAVESGNTLLGVLIRGGGLALVATMNVKDTPDTRSWTSLPALIRVGRVKLKEGTHAARVTVSGRTRTKQVLVQPGRLNLMNFSQLR